MKIQKVREVKTPTRGTSLSAGIDFYVPYDFDSTVVLPNRSIVIPSGIKANVPNGHALIAFNKSGVATKKDFQVGACVVDEDYQGEIHIHLTNIGKRVRVIEPGDKIVQFILIPVFYDKIELVSTNENLFNEITERADGWQGSTGNN
jgi:dUTP pyrophosphatase